MGTKGNARTIFLTVEGIGDRSVDYGGGATAADFALSLAQQPPAVPQTLQVIRTSSVLPPALPIEAADLRFGDLVRLVPVDSEAGVDQSLVASNTARLNMLSGPAAGTSFELEPGVTSLGRVSTNDVTIVDPSISRHHATVTVSAASVIIEDNGSTNGVTVAGRLLTAPTHIRSGEQIKLGQSEAVLIHNVVPSGGPDLSYLDVPSPAVAHYQGRIVSLPSPPLMAEGGARRTGRLSLGRNQQKQELELFNVTLATVTGQLDQEQQIERATRFVESPSFAEVFQAVASGNSVWAKRASDPCGVEARIGLGRVPSRIQFESLPGGPQELRAKLAATVERFSYLHTSPATVELGQLGSLGIQGPIHQARALVYSLVGQLCASYGPDQLGIAVRPGERHQEWDWLKWLPHTDFVGSAAGVEEGEFISWVIALFDGQDQPTSGLAWSPAAILVVLDDDRPLPSAVQSRLVQEGPALGIHTILLSDETRGFDTVLGATIRVQDGTAAFLREGFEPITGIAVESCDHSQIESLARLLSPIGYHQDDPDSQGIERSDEPDSPAATSHPFVLGGQKPTILAPLRRRSVHPPSSILPPQTPIAPAPPAVTTLETIPVTGPEPDLAATADTEPAASPDTEPAASPDTEPAASPDTEPAASPDTEQEPTPYTEPEPAASPQGGSPAAEPMADSQSAAEARSPEPQPLNWPPPEVPAAASPAPLEFPTAPEPPQVGNAAPGLPPPPPPIPQIELPHDQLLGSPPPNHEPTVPAVEPPSPPSPPRPEAAAEGDQPQPVAEEADRTSQPQDAADRESALNLASLPHPADDSRLVLGTVELEGGQATAVFALNLPRDKSLGLIGGAASGRTTALRSVAAATGMLRVDPGRTPSVYYMDVSGDLESIQALPHVSGASKTDIVGFRSLVENLEQLVARRKQAFSEAGAETLEDYRQVRPAEETRRVIVLVDDIAAVGELLDSLHPGRWAELACQIVNHGGPLGIHLVFSANAKSDIDQDLIPKIGRWMHLGADGKDGTPGRPGHAVVGKGRVRFATIDGRSPEAGVADLAG